LGRIEGFLFMAAGIKITKFTVALVLRIVNKMMLSSS
jgi:hypothetical protein